MRSIKRNYYFYYAMPIYPIILSFHPLIICRLTCNKFSNDIDVFNLHDLLDTDILSFHKIYIYFILHDLAEKRLHGYKRN